MCSRRKRAKSYGGRRHDASLSLGVGHDSGACLTVDPALDDLRPILESPSFANTLLLIGSPYRLSDLDSLFPLPGATPPSTYPQLRLLQADQYGHPLASIIAQAKDVAYEHRLANRQKRKVLSSSPTRPLSTRVSRRSSIFSMFSRASDEPSQAFRMAERPASLVGSSPGSASRPASMRRSSSRRRILDKIDPLRAPDLHVLPDSVPLFDAVLNFIPFFDCPKPFKDMFHDTILTTAAITPILTQSHSPTKFVHVLPPYPPSNLASVLEASFLSYFSAVPHGERIFAALIASAAWNGLSVGSVYTPAEMVLFGGVACPVEVLKGRGDFVGRAYLDRWDRCFHLPGLLGEVRQPEGGNEPGKGQCDGGEVDVPLEPESGARIARISRSLTGKMAILTQSVVSVLGGAQRTSRSGQC